MDQDYLTPLWVEEFLNNDELFELFTEGMRLRDEVFNEFEYFIKFEKCCPEIKQGELSRLAITTLLTNEPIVKRLLQRFREHHYITTGMIDAYEEKIQLIKDKVREITIRENLGDK